MKLIDDILRKYPIVKIGVRFEEGCSDSDNFSAIQLRENTGNHFCVLSIYIHFQGRRSSTKVYMNILFAVRYSIHVATLEKRIILDKQSALILIFASTK